jgi:hypothetical protein
MTDGRCRFGARAKREMVARLSAGETARRVARSMSCSPTTVTTARDRWERASEADRVSGAWCAPRRPVPRSCPSARSRSGASSMPAPARTRGRCDWPRWSAATARRCGRCSSATACRAAGAAASARRSRGLRGASRARCCTSTPMDAPRFDRPGHRVTGDRDKHGPPAGWARRRSSPCRTTTPALLTPSCTAPRTPPPSRSRSGVGRRGCASRASLEAVLSDNATCYTGHRFQHALHELGARHIRIAPYTRAGTASWSASSAPSKTNGRTAVSGRTRPPATARCHRSCATSTADAHTQPPAADHPSPASSRSTGRTTSWRRAGGRGGVGQRRVGRLPLPPTRRRG